MNPAVFSPLVRLAAPAEPTLDGLARRLALPTAGLVVFNPSPFGQSGVLALETGGLRVVTDVPGLGYAFEPATSPRPGDLPPPREALRPVETARYAARLDQRTGALASLVERAGGRELAAAGGALNARDGAVLTDAWVERFPAVATRLTARRTDPGGDFTSRVTLYDALPWVDIENVADRGDSTGGETRFELSLAPEAVSREVPGGGVAGPPPLEPAPMLRWISLTAGDETVLVGSAAPATVGVTQTGHVSLRVAAATQRFRLAVHRGYVLPDEPWRFGFGMVPMVAVPAAGSGSLRLPTFGRLLDVADPAVAVVGLKDADDGVGVVAYLMDLAGLRRDVVVRPGLLTFDGGVATDLTERDHGSLTGADGGGVLVPVDAGGYAACRLLGVRVAG